MRAVAPRCRAVHVYAAVLPLCATAYPLPPEHGALLWDVVLLPHLDTDAEELVRRADEAMYAAKARSDQRRTTAAELDLT